MRRHSSWRLADLRELAQARAQQRPRTRVRVLVAQATNIGMAGPLLACNPKGPYHDGITYGPSNSATWGQETTSDWGDGDGDDDWGGPALDILGDGDGHDRCLPLPAPDGPTVTLGPDDAAGLPEIAAQAIPGTTILLQDGVYDLSASQPIRLSAPGVTLRSASDQRDTVILDGGHVLDELVILEADDTTIAHLSLHDARLHAVRVTGATDAHTTGSRIHDIAVRNPGRRAILIERSDAGWVADGGVVSCSHIDLSDAGRAALDGCDIGGVEARRVIAWNVRDNVLTGFWCSTGMAEPAIAFSHGSRNTLIQRNTIHDSAAGIALGRGQLPDDPRTWIDDPCPAAVELPDHIGGIVRNNAIWAGRPELLASEASVVFGISLERACGVGVYHNSVVALSRVLTSIIHRWPETDAHIANNLVTHGILPDGGSQALLESNIVRASLDVWLDPQDGQLHLAEQSSAIDAGILLDPGLCDDDIDGDPRSDAPDLGADEVSP